MTIRLVTDEKIAETSSKGNQEKWYDQAADCWYKLDQFGYEALAETVVSVLLEQSNLETDTPFTFVRYHMERLQVHGRERTGCSSRNFLQPGQALITVNRLLSSHLGKPLREKLANVIKLAAKEEAAEDHRILKEIQKELIRKKRQQKQTEAAPSEKGYRRGQRAEA